MIRPDSYPRYAGKDDTEDPMPYMSGCFERDEPYPVDRFVLTYPVQC